MTTTRTAPTGFTVPAYSLKSGDLVTGRYVYDTEPAMVGRLRIKFQDNGADMLVRPTDTMTVEN
jgi:hypothetical protein